jgi:hypothetical protein
LGGKELEIIENSGDGLGVAQIPASDHPLQLLAAIGAGNYFLVFFRFRLSGSQAFRKEDEHALLQKTRSWENVQKNSQVPRAKSRLLNEFAGRRCFGSLAGIHAAGD